MEDAQIGEVQGSERFEMGVQGAVGHRQWRLRLRSGSLSPLGELLQYRDVVQFLAQLVPQNSLWAWISTRGLDEAFRRGKPIQ